MSFYEIKTIKPVKAIKSLNPQQARIASLKRNTENAKQAYKAEKDRQKVAGTYRTHALRPVPTTWFTPLPITSPILWDQMDSLGH